MKLLLNGNELGFTLENEKSVGDLLRSLELECEKNNATIIHIKIDGTDIEAAKIEDLNSCLIENTNMAEITTVSSVDILQSMKDIVPEVQKVASSFEELPVILQSGDLNKAGTIIKSFTDLFDVLCHLATLTALFPSEFAEKKINGLSISEFIKSFSPVLADFENAFSTSDTVLTGDLAEYEIKPRLESYCESVRSY